MKKILLILSLLALSVGCNNAKEIKKENIAMIIEKDKFAIRTNMIGYLKNDKKIAVIGTDVDMSGKLVKVYNNDDELIYEIKVGADRGGKNSPYKHNFELDFSKLDKEGTYYIQFDNNRSENFEISNGKIYVDAFNLVMDFYKGQRCGTHDTIYHKACHLKDKEIARVKDLTGKIVEVKNKLDLSGGWHDAGDNIKYMITITLTAIEFGTAADYAREFNYSKFIPDRNKNGIDDLTDETKIGADWILKMTDDYKNGNLYYQVDGEEDHGDLRNIENDDKTRGARLLRKGFGLNILGRSAATLAITSRLYESHDKIYAKKCLDRAIVLWDLKKNYTDALPSDPNYFYGEKEWRDDMVLGAAEIYQTTGDKKYKDYVIKMFNTIGKDNEKIDIGWENVEFLAYAASYRAGILKDKSYDKMKKALDFRMKSSENDVHYLSSGYTWGTTAYFTADAQKAIMFKYLTGDKRYMQMAKDQRDYLLGRNNWGISFVVGLGERFPVNSHSNISWYLAKSNPVKYLNGAVVGGPAKRKHWEKHMVGEESWKFKSSNFEDDRFKNYQSDVVYFDHISDYYCNEVAIDYASSSIFIFLEEIVQANLDK